MSGVTTSIERSDANMSGQADTHTHRRFDSEDIRLLEKAKSSSCAFNKIVEGNSMEHDYLGSIDNFIASIERKLDRVESFFGTKTNGKKPTTEEEDSYATLQNLYDTLITIKNSVFSSSVNLESFNAILDEHYAGLLSAIESSESLGFQERLLTALHFLDAKINQFNSLVESETKTLLHETGLSTGGSSSTGLSTDDAIKTFEVKFHNYEHAIREGCHRNLHYFELPFPWRENPYIVFGYRFQSNHLHALQSVCQCHNETANIWTHLFASMFMVYTALFTYPKSDIFQNGTLMDNVIIYMYLSASFFCLFSSSVWHTFNGTANMYLRKKFACIDYTGITVLITAAVVTTEYAALYYHPILRSGFIAFSLICGVFGFFFNWSSYFDRPESKPFRIAFFISLSGLGFAAFVYLAFEKGLSHALHYYLPLTRSHIWYLTGVGFYASLVPERFRTDVIVDTKVPEEVEWSSPEVTENLDLHFKEKPVAKDSTRSLRSLWFVDYIFASHNIWHIFVLMGAFSHYTGVCEMFRNIPLNK